jgi:hypothetical protein
LKGYPWNEECPEIACRKKRGENSFTNCKGQVINSAFAGGEKPFKRSNSVYPSGAFYIDIGSGNSEQAPAYSHKTIGTSMNFSASRPCSLLLPVEPRQGPHPITMVIGLFDNL